MNMPPDVQGLVTIPGKHSVPDTLARLESVVKARGLRVFARIDFSGDAAREGLTLQPMVQLVFGSPKAGTPLLAAAPTVGIDLPLKILIWEDADGGVWLSYNDPDALAQRHSVPAELSRNIAGIRALAAEAAKAGL
jgi:uncharacterized protein (DUF302 family)